MKLILGDNQFFGVNHADLAKAEKTSELFDGVNKISNFITNAIELGMDGFMINSNELGFEAVARYDFTKHTECHYSIPYPHKYAGVVNESGMISLLTMVLKRLKATDFWHLLRFVFTLNVSYLIPLIVRTEIPKSLPMGSVVYLQNVVTDLIMGLKRADEIFEKYITTIKSMGYKPGFITLNLGHLEQLFDDDIKRDEVYVCFNLNYSGFNVFPNKSDVERTIIKIKENTNWKLMAMSVFSSGSHGISISQSINYIGSQAVDYVVFGSSNLSNIESNVRMFKVQANL